MKKNVLIKDSKRSIDVNGYMEIKDCILTETGVAEYLGKEIPNYETFSLKAEEIYKVYRPLEVLERAVNTFNNVPVTLEHPEDLNAETFKDVAVYGATGEQSRIEDGKLLNNIIIFDERMIKLIESGEISDLSCGYFWTVEKADDPNYDFVITEITGNHVAIVETPRIEGAKIADSKKTNHKMSGDIMKNIKKWFVKDSVLTDSLDELKAEIANLLSKFELEDKIEIEFKEKEVLDSETEDSETEDSETEDSETEDSETEDCDLVSEDNEVKVESYTKDEVDKMLDQLRDSLRAEDEEKEEAFAEAKEILGDVEMKATDANSIRKMILDAKGISHKKMNKSEIKGAVSALKSVSKSHDSKKRMVADAGYSSFSKEFVARLGGK